MTHELCLITGSHTRPSTYLTDTPHAAFFSWYLKGLPAPRLPTCGVGDKVPGFRVIWVTGEEGGPQGPCPLQRLTHTKPPTVGGAHAQLVPCVPGAKSVPSPSHSIVTNAQDAQDELPSLGSSPTGSMPQDLVRVCKNQQKHTRRDLTVSIRNPAYTQQGHRRGRIFSSYLLFLDAEAAMLIPGAATAGGRALGSHPQPVQLPTWWGRRSQRQASLRVAAQPPSSPHPPDSHHTSPKYQGQVAAAMSRPPHARIGRAPSVSLRTWGEGV